MSLAIPCLPIKFIGRPLYQAKKTPYVDTCTMKIFTRAYLKRKACKRRCYTGGCGKTTFTHRFELQYQSRRQVAF